jgi:hypothetical protein
MGALRHSLFVYRRSTLAIACTFAILGFAVAAGVAAASIGAYERYCQYCIMRSERWDAQSIQHHTYDWNGAWDCSSATSCGSWYTCVSEHYYGSSTLFYPRACGSSGFVSQGVMFNGNLNVDVTAYCYNGDNSDHHQFCEVRAYT